MCRTRLVKYMICFIVFIIQYKKHKSKHLILQIMVLHPWWIMSIHPINMVQFKVSSLMFLDCGYLLALFTSSKWKIFAQYVAAAIILKRWKYAATASVLLLFGLMLVQLRAGAAVCFTLFRQWRGKQLIFYSVDMITLGSTVCSAADFCGLDPVCWLCWGEIYWNVSQTTSTEL